MDESIKPPNTSNEILNPSLDYVGTKKKLKQEKIEFSHGKLVNIYMIYEIQLLVKVINKD